MHQFTGTAPERTRDEWSQAPCLIIRLPAAHAMTMPAEGRHRGVLSGAVQIARARGVAQIAKVGGAVQIARAHGAARC